MSPRSDATSVFDDLLERGRRELDALGGPAPTRPPTPQAQRAATASAAPRSAAMRVLDDKLGPGWRHEVLERFREGDELVVKCRVSVPGGAARTQFGSARLGSRGATGGTPFSLGTGADDEQAAERAAVESALAACARLA